MFLFEFSKRGKLSSDDEPTCSPLLYLPRRNSKHTQDFCHNLSHNIRNRRSRRDFCIGLETNEEVFDFVEKLDQRIATRSRVPRRLREKVLLRPT